jgi:hypothetical protein
MHGILRATQNHNALSPVFERRLQVKEVISNRELYNRAHDIKVMLETLVLIYVAVVTRFVRAVNARQIMFAKRILHYPIR